MGKGEMGDGVTVPVGGEVCKNVRGEWHRVNGRMGNGVTAGKKGKIEIGVTVPVGGEVCKNVRGEWHRVNGRNMKRCYYVITGREGW